MGQQFHSPDIYVTRGNLPHWSSENVPCFVTFRLADSLPQGLLMMWKHEYEIIKLRHADVKLVPRDQYIHNMWEKYLDSGYGECFLQKPEFRQVLVDALFHYDEVRYKLHSFVVMPNHVHLLIEMFDGFLLQDALQSIKRFTSRQINFLIGRSQPFWQREYYDRLIRDVTHYYNVLMYIKNNPFYLTSDRFSYYIANECQDYLNGKKTL